MIDFFELRENYRTLARAGMGTESKGEARVGLELDYYDGSGTKRMGKITKVGPKGYIVKDEKDGKNRQFTFHDRAKAKEILARLGKGKYNESVQENKIFFVKVGDGRDSMTVKVKADTKGAAVKKLKAKYPKYPVSLDRNQKQGKPAGALESVEEAVKTEDKGQFIYAAKQAKKKGDSTFVFAGKTYNCEEVLGENSKKATIQYVVVVKKTDRIVGVGATEKRALDSATIGSAHSGVTQFNPAFEVPRDVVVRKLPKKVPSSGVLGQNYSRFVKNINKPPGAHARAQADILAK